MRVAAVDLGTNSTRLLVADVERGEVREVVRRLAITGLGEGAEARGRLLPLPIARVRNVLTDYRREAERLGAERTLAFATSAVRDADNGEAFLGEVEWSYGFTTRLLSGTEEALLTYEGVTAGRELHAGTLVVDIGGGSTELLVGLGDGVGFLDSLDVGCVRLTERFLLSDPPTPAELKRCGQAVRTLLCERVPEDVRAGVGFGLGVAGTVTTIAALDLGLVDYDQDRVHGYVVSRAAVEQQLERLASLPLAERRKVPGLEPDRARVIVAGAVVLREVLVHFDLRALEASERDILHGAALEAAKLPAPEEGAVPPGAFTCC